MGIIGIWVVGSYGMRTGSKQRKSAEREPLLAAPDAAAGHTEANGHGELANGTDDGALSRR
ncbi:laccase 3 [Ilyonectria robusta]